MSRTLTISLVILLAVLVAAIAVLAWTLAPDPSSKPALLALCGTFLTATVTVLGWYGAYSFAKEKEDRARRLEIRLKYRAQQVGELYGPLLSLIEQIFNVWRVRENILDHVVCTDEEKARVREVMWERYFKPLHGEIKTLLRTKLYLLEGDAWARKEGEILAQSFSEYLEHATQEDCQHLLGSELSLDTSGVPPKEWPDAFYTDVKSKLSDLINEHRSGLIHEP